VRLEEAPHLPDRLANLGRFRPAPGRNPV
jgi:hypothetical protein